MQSTIMFGNSKDSDDQASKKFCKVCGDAGAGVFFGVRVCIPCKAFFIRSTADNCGTFVCLGQKNCSVTADNRACCKHCRFQKCISVGMIRRERPKGHVTADGQMLCVVCKDVANGVHFGAVTCEGCKKFFRRGQKEAPSYTCRGDKKCAINPTSRNACRYCRFQKCLRVGMSREAIQMGRPSKIRRLDVSNKEDSPVKRRELPERRIESSDVNMSPAGGYGSSNSSFMQQTATLSTALSGVTLSPVTVSEATTSDILPNGINNETSLYSYPNHSLLTETTTQLQSVSVSSPTEDLNKLIIREPQAEWRPNMFCNAAKAHLRNLLTNQDQPDRTTNEKPAGCLDSLPSFGTLDVGSEERLSSVVAQNKSQTLNGDNVDIAKPRVERHPQSLEAFDIVCEKSVLSQEMVADSLNCEKSYDHVVSVADDCRDPAEILGLLAICHSCSDDARVMVIDILKQYTSYLDKHEEMNKMMVQGMKNFAETHGDIYRYKPTSILKTMVEQFVKLTIQFCQGMPGFLDLHEEDQGLLVLHGEGPSRILMSCVHWYNPDTGEFDTGFYVNTPVPGRCDYELYKQWRTFGGKIRNLKLDMVEAALLHFSVMMTTDCPDIRDPAKIEKALKPILKSFQAYTRAKYGSNSTRMDDLFSHIPTLRLIGKMYMEVSKIIIFDDDYLL